jgi:hypothetical protein
MSMSTALIRLPRAVVAGPGLRALALAGMARVLGLGGPVHASEIALGSIRIETPEGDLRGGEFRRSIMAGLVAMQAKSPYLAQLLKAAQEAPFPITVSPLMEDPRTYVRGEPYRAHAGPAGPRSVGRGGWIGYPALVYLTLANVNPHWSSSKRGVLVHELVHAVDLAYGRIPADRLVAERRAVFMQNLWRDVHGWDLSEWYHDQKLGSFETLEYQRAKRQGLIDRCVDRLLTIDTFSCP